MPTVGVITGVRNEADALRTVLGAKDSPIIRFSGARSGVAATSVDELLSLGVNGILSFGSAGGLSPDHKPGDLIVGHKVATATGETWQCDEDWTKNLVELLGVESHTVFGSDGVAGISAKNKIFKESSAAAIDMESHIVASKAAKHGVPFAILRAVVDPDDFEIPSWVLDSVRPNGTVSLLPILSGMCIFPWQIGRLASLGNYNKRAMESLSGAVGVLGPGLGLFTL